MKIFFLINVTSHDVPYTNELTMETVGCYKSMGKALKCFDTTVENIIAHFQDDEIKYTIEDFICHNTFKNSFGKVISTENKDFKYIIEIQTIELDEEEIIY